MRILFCFVGGRGHFEPMVPVARAAALAGHDLAVACGPSHVPMVQAAGFPAFGIGPRAAHGPRARVPLREVDPAREEQDLRDRFAGTAARARALGVGALATNWRPDVIVADEVDFGSVVAAEVLGLPYATVLVIATGSLVRPEVVAPTLDRIRGEHGLAPDPDLAAPSRYLVLSPFPTSLRDPAFPLPATAQQFRPIAVKRRTGPPIWSQSSAGRPTVYFTLGTEFNLESGDLFTRVIAGLRDLHVNVLVTVGHQIDPAELGPQPVHIQIVRYLPQAEILPHCDLAIFHGGSGTLTGVVAHGLPMALLPMGADQPANALRCQALGLGLSLNPLRVTPGEIRDNAAALLAEPAFRHAAQRLQAETARLPEPATTVAFLERLARDRTIW